MLLEERDEGEFRIYAGAMEGRTGDGYIAAVVVSRVRGTDSGPRETYRNDALAGGHRWESPQLAIRYAIATGREVLKTERLRLAAARR